MRISNKARVRAGRRGRSMTGAQRVGVNRTSRSRSRLAPCRRSSDRAPFDVLVLDAGSRQGLAAIRSLGRAGLTVAAAECFVDGRPELPVHGFRSRYTAHCEVLPDHADDPDSFAEAVVDLVRRHPTPVVLAGSDGAVAALLPRRSELEVLGSSLALPRDPALEVVNHRERTFAVARRLGIEAPHAVRVEGLDDLTAALDQLGLPLVLEPAVSCARRSQVRLQATEVIDREEARRVCDALLAAGVEVLAQEVLPGRREGVTVMVTDGHVRATFAHVEHRTTPAFGGASVVRESIPVPIDLDSAAARLIGELGLEGLSGFEFRRDSGGRPRLLEIYARLGEPTELAVRCGVDLPVMLWRWASGQRVAPVQRYRQGIRMRWLRGDLHWLRDNRRRQGRPDSVSPSRSLWMFVSEFGRTRHHDTFDLKDPRPSWAEVRALLASVHEAGRSRARPAGRGAAVGPHGAADAGVMNRPGARERPPHAAS